MSTQRAGWAAVAAGVVALAALLARAQQSHLPVGRSLSHGDAIQSAIARLNVTPEQDAKLKAISETESAKLRDLGNQIRPAHDALDAAARAAKPDPTAVGKAYLNVLAAEAAVKTEYAKFHDAVAAVLTAEQKAQFESYLNSQQGGQGHWRAHASWRRD